MKLLVTHTHTHTPPKMLYLLKTQVCNLKKKCSSSVVSVTVFQNEWKALVPVEALQWERRFHLFSYSDAHVLLCVRSANVLEPVLCVARWHR